MKHILSITLAALYVLWLLLGINNISFADPVPIDISEQYYRCYGHYSYNEHDFAGLDCGDEDTYSKSGAIPPISCVTNRGSGYGGTNVNISGTADYLHARCDASGIIVCPPDLQMCSVTVDSEVMQELTFRPFNSDTLTFSWSFDYSGISPSGFFLDDKTTGEHIFGQSLGQSLGQSQSGSKLLNLNPVHDYHLYLEVVILRDYNVPTGGQETFYNFGDFQATITPEPTTLLLLGFGAVILRKRR